MVQDIVMVVGLGNSGFDYENICYNVGVLFVEVLVCYVGQMFCFEKKYYGFYVCIQWQGFDLYLLNFFMFMNCSGLFIKVLVDFFKIVFEQILVVYDEFDLFLGIVKLKKGGGYGGYNGLWDIIVYFGSKEFQCLCLGIGYSGDSCKVIGFVFGWFGKKEIEELFVVFDEVMCVLFDVVNGKLVVVMN